MTYLDAGWVSPLPVPVRSKRISVVGYTGWHGIAPSYADVQTWIDTQPRSNIALRLPPYVLGIDVDAYSDKPGAATLAACSAQWGALPSTWRTTSRDDGISGIRLFLVPPDLDWPGQLPGGGVETVHVGHRYVMAPPSVHPEGRRYRWIDPDGLDTLAVPAPSDLARLPDGWVTGLSRGAHVDEPSADMTRSAISGWLTELPGYTAEPCPIMARYMTRTVGAMVDGASRHDALLAGLLTLVRFGESGHRGLAAALAAVRRAFLAAVTLDKSRGETEALAELERALAGAVARVAASPGLAAGTAGDPCGLAAAPGSVALPTPGTTTANLPGPPDPFATEPAAADPAVIPEPTSWARAAIELAIMGEHAEGPPSVLERSDGLHLLYAGRINGIIGASESGKTWLALEACRQVMAAGHRVLYLDFEDTVPGVIGRLLTLQVAAEHLRGRFAYVGPSEQLGPPQMADLMVELATIGPADLIVLDGFNAAMTLQGLDLMSNKDVTAFYQQLLRRLMATGACIGYVDHTPKNDAEGESRGGIGAQAKRAMTTGTILRCDIRTPFGRGETGYINVVVDKDRSGHIRERSPGRVVGTAVLRSTAAGAVVTIAIDPPDGRKGAVDRHPLVMRAVSDFLATVGPEGASSNLIEQGVRGKGTNTDKKREAVRALVAEGYVRAEVRGQAIRHHLVKPYIAELDPLLGNLAQPRLEPRLGEAPETSPARLPPYGVGEVARVGKDHPKTTQPRLDEIDADGPEA